MLPPRSASLDDDDDDAGADIDAAPSFYPPAVPSSSSSSMPMRPASSYSAISAHRQPSPNAPIMPIRIDPEEEKRLSLLRKRIQQSEFEREKIEIRYLSLRAHYVHESQLGRAIREYERARWELLGGMVNRRAHALGLMRARMAIARDVEALLLARARGEMPGDDVDDDVHDAHPLASEVASGDAAAAPENDGPSANSEDVKNGERSVATDLVAIWNDLNARLRAAESACVEFETPPALSRMAATMMTSSSDAAGNNGARSARKRSNSVTSEDETTSADSSNNVKNDASTSGRMRAVKSKGAGMEPHVIPWDCVVEPQTPYELPLLLSCLSSATDKVAGYGKGDRFDISLFSFDCPCERTTPS